MPYVTIPPNHGTHHSKGPASPDTITWVNDVTPPPHSYKLVIGSNPGDSDLYPGRVVLHPTLFDNQVNGLPGGGATCNTDVRYRKIANGPWWGVGDQFTDFTCVMP